MNNTAFIVTLAILLLVPFAAAQTPPHPPHQFFGEVTINGQQAPAGTEITARVSGDIYGSTIIQNAGEYGLDDIFYVEAAGGQSFDGMAIAFYIDGEPAETYTPYQHGQSTRLDLSAQIEGFGEEDQETASSGGGGGGGFATASAGSGSQPNAVDLDGVNPAEQRDAASADSGTRLNLSCVPDWRCSEWTQCVNGFQNRRCVDINQCGTNESLPAEQRTCEVAPAPAQQAGIGNFLTGAVVGDGQLTWGGLLGALIVFAVLAGLYVFARRR